MDDRGRLHMPGFVGKTFEELGIEPVKEKAQALRTMREAEQEKLKQALSEEEKRLDSIPLNRHHRRQYEKLRRK